MAKILISPLGTGSLDKNNTATRKYRPANYRIDGKDYQKSFIASALYEHLELDGIIFIGTVKSMWEEVYESFCKEKNLECNADYYCQLADKIDQMGYRSSLDSLDLSLLESVLGSKSKCILIKYGLDQAELWENFDQIIQVIYSLQDKDELYLDITHSFRSLSVFQFLTVTFIQDLFSEKKINIAGVFYGMLDVTQELGYTPVVDLNPLFEITSWIKGAYSLKNYGNGDLIAELLKEQGEDALANQIAQLSQAININYVNAIKQNSTALKSSLYNPSQSRPFNYLRGILEKFAQKFTRSSITEAEYQLELAGWYFENQRYATGYITLAEAIITYVCEIQGKNSGLEEARNEMKTFLHRSDNKNRELAQLYFKVNPIRTAIAHALIDKKRASASDAIANAEGYYQQAKQIFKTKKMG
ncbi:CRISPR-associated protein [Oscillatoriales cyanobacterium USR001]|nr:CRISPR-associated protein [Oscillatoriales cyanobacterium USR001]